MKSPSRDFKSQKSVFLNSVLQQMFFKNNDILHRTISFGIAVSWSKWSKFGAKNFRNDGRKTRIERRLSQAGRCEAARRSGSREVRENALERSASGAGKCGKPCRRLAPSWPPGAGDVGCAGRPRASAQRFPLRGTPPAATARAGVVGQGWRRDGRGLSRKPGKPGLDGI